MYNFNRRRPVADPGPGGGGGGVKGGVREGGDTVRFSLYQAVSPTTQ